MNRSGEYVNNLSGDMAYQSFKPAPLPPSGGLFLDEKMLQLISDANASLSELNSMGELIPNADIFVSMYVRKEALISSQIEGTQCTLDDILDPDSEATTNLDVSDVINYIKAVSFAIEKLDELPICARLLRETHKVLMNNVRGEEKNPGEFRTSQNWIGAAGCTLKDARYVPPNVEDMKEAISELDRYMNESIKYDIVVRTALIHYQFETIHPFLDGNGRIGRLLILLYLMEQRVLSKPILYLSYYLKKNQYEYYDRISEVRRSGNYEQWICFFAEAITVACKDAIDTINTLSELHKNNLQLISGTPKSKEKQIAFFEYIEKYPILDIGKTAKALKTSFNTAASFIQKFESYGILKEVEMRKRNRVYEYTSYLDILRKNT